MKTICRIKGTKIDPANYAGLLAQRYQVPRHWRPRSRGWPGSEGGRMSAATKPTPACATPVDPIADLIARLTAAADTGSALSIGGRVRVTVRRVPAGFAIERGGCR